VGNGCDEGTKATRKAIGVPRGRAGRKGELGVARILVEGSETQRLGARKAAWWELKLLELVVGRKTSTN